MADPDPSVRSHPVGGSAEPARLAIQATKAGAVVEAAALHLDLHRMGCVRPSAGEATDDDATGWMASVLSVEEVMVRRYIRGRGRVRAPLWAPQVGPQDRVGNVDSDRLIEPGANGRHHPRRQRPYT